MLVSPLVSTGLRKIVPTTKTTQEGEKPKQVIVTKQQSQQDAAGDGQVHTARLVEQKSTTQGRITQIKAVTMMDTTTATMMP